MEHQNHKPKVPRLSGNRVSICLLGELFLGSFCISRYQPVLAKNRDQNLLEKTQLRRERSTLGRSSETLEAIGSVEPSMCMVTLSVLMNKVMIDNMKQDEIKSHALEQLTMAPFRSSENLSSYHILALLHKHQ